MSDHAVHSHNDGSESVRQSRRLFQSPRMTHLTDSLNYEFQEDCHLLGEESREVTDLVTANITDERLITTSQNFIKERYDCKETFVFQIDPNSGFESPSTGKCTNSDIFFEKAVKFHNFFENNSLAASKSSEDDFVVTTSPYSSKAPILSMCIGEEMNPSSSLLASKENTTNSKFHNLSEGSQMFRESRASAKFKGKMISEVLSLSRDSGFHGHQGLKLQLLGSSTDSEEKEIGGHANTSPLHLKNESSADINTVEINSLQENRLSGNASCPANKDVDGIQVSRSSQVAIASARQDGGKRFLDINQKLPELPFATNSTDDKDTSSLRTQSLEADCILSNAEQVADSESNDPTIRWIKRLKLSSYDSISQGTKSSKQQESTSREKASRSDFPRSNKLSAESDGKFLDKPVAHSWIRRWRHNETTTTKRSPGAVVICEPESFKEKSDKFQKKHFASLAAMAMMGKALKRFRPCEFQKMGPSVVWSTKHALTINSDPSICVRDLESPEA